jgi:hypothetical protein
MRSCCRPSLLTERAAGNERRKINPVGSHGHGLRAGRAPLLPPEGKVPARKQEAEISPCAALYEPIVFLQVSFGQLDEGDTVPVLGNPAGLEALENEAGAR